MCVIVQKPNGLLPVQNLQLKYTASFAELTLKVITQDGTVLASIDTEEGITEFITCADMHYIVRSASEVSIWKMINVAGQVTCEPAINIGEQYSATEIRELKIPGISGLFVTGCSNSNVQVLLRIPI